jgi:hypothetical protein
VAKEPKTDKTITKAKVEDRGSDPGILIAGDEVLWDGEAEAWGIPHMTEAPPANADE